MCVLMTAHGHAVRSQAQEQDLYLNFLPVTTSGFVDAWAVPRKMQDAARIREVLAIDDEEERLATLRREFELVGGRSDRMLEVVRKAEVRGDDCVRLNPMIVVPMESKEEKQD